MVWNLGNFSIVDGSLLTVNFKGGYDELVEILGCGVSLLPKYLDYEMLKNCYSVTHQPQLKALLDLIETGDIHNVVVRFKIIPDPNN